MAQARRIARAVQPLLMLQDDIRNRPREIYRVQNIVSQLRVTFNQTKFNLIQMAGLAENFGRHVNFPQIMHQRRQSNAFDFMLRQPHFSRNRGRQFRDAPLMPSGVRIADFGGQRHRLNHAFHHLPQFLLHALMLDNLIAQPLVDRDNLLRPRRHQFFQLVLITAEFLLNLLPQRHFAFKLSHAQFKLARLILQQLLLAIEINKHADFAAENHRVQGFEQIIHRPRLIAFEDVERLFVAGRHENNRHVLRAFFPAHELRDFKPAHVRQLHV